METFRGAQLWIDDSSYECTAVLDKWAEEVEAGDELIDGLEEWDGTIYVTPEIGMAIFGSDSEDLRLAINDREGKFMWGDDGDAGEGEFPIKGSGTPPF